MKKFYVIFPAIGLVIFAALFWNFNREFDANEKAKQKQKTEELEKKRLADFEAKKKAVEEAISQQETRKREREAKAKKDAEEKQQQQDLHDQAEKARDDRDVLARQVDRLRIEIGVEETALKKLASEKANLIAEDEFLQKYVKAAEDNQKNLEKLLTKIDEVDKAAAIAAAQNANKKKS
ncbi:MAG: hypothetical protein QM790_12275 [Nibricoccus sp.]